MLDRNRAPAAVGALLPGRRPAGWPSHSRAASVLKELLDHRGVGQRGGVAQVPFVAGDFAEHPSHDLPCRGGRCRGGRGGKEQTMTQGFKPVKVHLALLVFPVRRSSANTESTKHNLCGGFTRSGLGESWSVLDVVWRGDGPDFIPHC